ncbi:MAG: phosphodiesterase [Leptothrix sp. (in: Bacteria)]|nr:phosphodiesterase [Leptothrix sp. (in: b-proteobacteria)]
MLKKIPVDRLRLGMHVHRLEGRWMDHPFWKTRFRLDNTDDLRRLQDSGLTECWIDPGLGLDVAEPVVGAPAPQPGPGTAPPVAEPAAAPHCATREPAGAGTAPRSMAAEMKEAAAICDRGREAVVAMFGEARMGKTIDASGCLDLVDDISSSILRNPGALVSLARLKTKDGYTYMHSVAVCALMVALGRQIGMSVDECRTAGQAGLMHDIGKALMPLEVLNKPGKLTDAEFAVIRSHPERGHGVLLEGQGATPEMLDVVLNHHERIDGAGYPRRLPPEQLSRLARMGAICDVYDAITSNRPYKDGWDPAESIARMASWKGQFDTTLFTAFVQSLGIYPTGSLVKLASQRVAIVAEQTPGNMVAPVVMAFYSLRSQLRIAPQRLDLARAGCNDRIVGRHTEDASGFGNLDELWADPEVLRRRGR